MAQLTWLYSKEAFDVLRQCWLMVAMLDKSDRERPEPTSDLQLEAHRVLNKSAAAPTFLGSNKMPQILGVT